MSLPKNRKRRNDNLITGKEKLDELLASSQHIRSIEKTEKNTADTDRNKQMIKAFEIVEHIEHTHGITENDEKIPTSTPLISPVSHHGSLNSKRLQVKVSFNHPPDKEIETYNRSDEENMPVIEVKLKIPSFFRKVPILKGITDNLIRRFAKE
jgi:hypothetical protein